MKIRLSNFNWLVMIFVFTFIQSTAQSQLKRNNLFDFGWRFHLGGALGAEGPSFDDSQWRMIDLPHDWSIEDLPGANSPFNIDAISQVNGGFTTGGTGWYRKTFTVPQELKNKHFIIMFEGVYMNAEIWMNGEFLGKHPYGYTSFWFDISGKIKFDKENILTVKVKNEGENSRWYSGSGIYRHVWLKVVSPVHITTWGTYITTTQATEKEALINLKTSVENQSGEVSKIKLVTKIINANAQEQTHV
jgi:beta-galactosidase